MRKAVTSGVIRVHDELGFPCHIARIDYVEYEDETFDYTFTPRYPVIDMLPTTIFQGIPGLDLDMRKECYLRRNIVPTFIAERTPSERREDLQSLLESYGMTYLNRLEWLIRTDLRYSGDLLYVERWSPSDEKRVVSMGDLSQFDPRATHMISALLTEICQGNDITTSSFSIDDSNRSTCYHLLSELLRKEKSFLANRREEGWAKAALTGKTRGRKRAVTNLVDFDAVRHAHIEGRITAEEAAQRLGISRSTFYRRIKEFKA
ncbi:helix-turn-helix domain-containing protein [Adlercreutzia sp. ZJ138]|uniref:helix-turn-helix domain-containing protein n=1 Tax=Adlercreutzia sp. ZJ138 TaxID=2709405 RepID=UPI0013EBA0EB|nr:helix-turn-helix domain-containing protein [Adlercreutzia sp. ZJ138]